ncbi:polysaccharide deacetylase family protein [Priestia megaterium]|uniref:polysaccharide deacetylase family protein n=1 Tax=Priestia megaterium TaxID=1404 RepID=UPI0035BE6D86
MNQRFKPNKRFYAFLSLVLVIVASLFFITEAKGSESAASQQVLASTALPLKEAASSAQPEKLLNTLHHNMYVGNTLNDQNQALTQPVYLTFDDGPTPDTLHILDALRQYNVKATFFMLKHQIDAHPEIAKKVAQEGHAIGCHGVSHDIHVMYSEDGAALKEMQECQATVKKVTGVDSKLIRVPYGSVPYLKEPHRTELLSHFKLWDWNVDSEDWALRSAPRIIQGLEPHIQGVNSNGRTPVILFHDKSFTAQSLPAILTYLKQSGYQPIKIDNTMQPMQFPTPAAKQS